MASSTHIDGSLPASGSAPTSSVVFSGGWGVEYDWAADRAGASGQPTRLSALQFPPPFDRDLEGALRGQGHFSDFLYLFKAGQYLRIRQATMTPDGPPAPTAGAWDLPAHWTNLDAVFSGGGRKSGFAYFFRGDEYCRYDWATDRRSPGYPKQIASEWHTAAPFTRDFDGAITGQGPFSTKAYLFKTISLSVDSDGNPVPAGTPGSKAVSVPAYARYDFDTETTEVAVADPAAAVGNWNGLFPLLEAGPAVDTALSWCNAALAALAAKTLSFVNPLAPPDPATDAALSHHFMTGSATAAQITTLTAQMAALRDRVNRIPDRFRWTQALPFAAQTVPQTSTEIGDFFSIRHGPNGRAAVLLHEGVHFIFTGGPTIDVPEWSGETVNGVGFGIDSISNRAYHTLNPDEALTNPSSYSAFAQEIALRNDARFGDARRHE